MSQLKKSLIFFSSVPSVPSVVEKRKTTMEIRKNTERMKYESVKKVLNLYFFRAFSAFSG
ncbi:MAG TPA: hypothetical protein PKJ08_04770 [Candidatus Cloacimonadota bacterium]|nr:hypothetical protein [Candidatus Cloacimonadota bacterium]HPM00770.1 hypothetical protein [Candidatus Cloacimonadota bacterium]